MNVLPNTDKTVEKSLNESICENKNDPGLTNGNKTNIPKKDDVDCADVNFSVNDLPPHTSKDTKDTYADVVKSIEKKVTISPSSHFFKIIQ